MSNTLAKVGLAAVFLVTVGFLWATIPAHADDEVCVVMPAPEPYNHLDPQFFA